MADAAVPSGGGGGGGPWGRRGGGSGEYKVFAATEVPALAASRGVRRFADGGCGGGGASRNGSGNQGNRGSSMVAPSGWWVRL